VVVLAVDQRRVTVLRVALDALPHVQHRPAGGVDENTSDPAKLLEIVDCHAESRKNHHIVGRNAAEVEAPFARHENLDAHFAEAPVHMWVVNDFADEIDATIGKFAPRLIRVFNGSLDAVTEAELPSQPDRDVPDRKGVVLGPHAVYQAAAIVRGELVLDLGSKAETLSEIGTWVGYCHHGKLARWAAFR
jgi:hypothetical protein